MRSMMAPQERIRQHGPLRSYGQTNPLQRAILLLKPITGCQACTAINAGSAGEREEVCDPDKWKKQITRRVKAGIPMWIIPVIAFHIGFLQILTGQGNLNLSLGIGMPELLNIGARYQLDQLQFGLSLGTLPVGSDESLLTMGGDVSYHFGGSSRLAEPRPWYARMGLSFLRDEIESSTDTWLYLNARIGREFNISERVGISVGLGALLELAYQTEPKQPSNGWNLTPDTTPPVLPSIGVGFYVRI